MGNLVRFAIAAVCGLLMCGTAAAAEVYFAGFTFLGDHDAIQRNYPYSAPLAAPASDGPSLLDREIFSRVRGLSNPSFSLVFDSLGTLGPDSRSTIALALALDRETVSVE